MDLHLTSSQLDQLLQEATTDTSNTPAHQEHLHDARIHLEECAVCRAQLRAHQQALQRLGLIGAGTPGPRDSVCPPDDVWLDIAARIDRPNSAGHLSHAAYCDHCGPLLRQATEDFASELTAEEDLRLASLLSAAPGWQRAMAAQLLHSSSRAEAIPRPRSRLAKAATGISWGVAAATIVTAAVLITLWSTRRHPQIAEPSRLLASAYTEKRTIEPRFDDAGYAPLRQQRGDAGEDRMRRPALLKAEAAIAENLKAQPEDVSWLQASGRASLLEEDAHAPQNAVVTLEKAHRLDPNNLSVTTDLASAYLLRGEIANRPEDFGTAINFLGSVLAAEPQREAAQFNCALALEKQLLKRQALEAWQTFLKDHPHSQWVPEAKIHFEKLQQEIGERERRGSTQLKQPRDVIAALRSGNDGNRRHR